MNTDKLSAAADHIPFRLSSRSSFTGLSIQNLLLLSKFAMSILEQIASNRKNLRSSYADITGNIHDFKSLVPRLVAAGLVAPNQAQEAVSSASLSYF